MDGGDRVAEPAVETGQAAPPSAAVALLLVEAERLLADGDAAGARGLYQAALSLDLDCHAAAAGVIEAAELDLPDDLPAEPDLTKALEWVRRELFLSADEAAAEALSQAGAKIGPEGYETLAFLGLWHGDRAGAQRWLQRRWLLSLGGPDDPLLSEASHELLREYLLAVNAMRSVSDPGRARQLARLHLSYGDVAAARRHLSKAAKEGRSAEVLVALAALDNSKGDYHSAVKKLNVALQLTDERAWIRERKAATKRAIGLGLRGVSSDMHQSVAPLQVMTSPYERSRLMGWKFLRHFHRAERPDLVRPSVFQRVEASSGWVFPVTLGVSRKLSPHKGEISVFEHVPELVMKRVRRGQGHLLIDHGHEALFAHKDTTRNHFARMLEHLRDQDIPPERILILDGNLKAPETAQEIAARAGLAAPRILPNRYLWFQLSAAHRALRRAQGGVDLHAMDALESIAGRKPRPRRFLSFNGVPRPHRWALVSWLLEQGLLDKGLVSFKGPPGWGTRTAPIAKPLADAQSLADLKSPGATLKALRAIGPLMVDEAYAPDALVRWDRAFRRNPGWPYLETHFTVVTETVFTDGRSSASTEKLMKPIANLHPFLLIGDPGILKHVRARGFETFGRWFDESYDELSDPRARMAAVLGEVRRLAMLSDEDWADMAIEMQPVLLHNYYVFLELAPKMAEEIAQTIRAAIA